jgi:hypothetical protein
VAAVINDHDDSIGDGLRLTCQIIHIHAMPDGTSVDLVLLEDYVWQDVTTAAGTPMTLGFSADDHIVRRQLHDRLHHWEQACAVLDVQVTPEADGFRYVFAEGRDQLVVTVGPTT